MNQMPLDTGRYPKNWTDIALKVKEAADWQCQCCGKQCRKPGEGRQGLTRSQWTSKILQTHHRNRKPEDNRLENLLAVCTSCHLAMHRGGHGNVNKNQLSLW